MRNMLLIMCVMGCDDTDNFVDIVEPVSYVDCPYIGDWRLSWFRNKETTSNGVYVRHNACSDGVVFVIEQSMGCSVFNGDSFDIDIELVNPDMMDDSVGGFFILDGGDFTAWESSYGYVGVDLHGNSLHMSGLMRPGEHWIFRLHRILDDYEVNGNCARP